MTGLFGFLVTASAAATGIWLLSVRRTVATAFGGGRTALVFVGFAVLANLAPVLAGERSSALIGVLVLALLAWVVRAGRPVRFGPSDRWLRISWLAAAALLVWCLGVDVLVGSGLYGSRLVAYVAAALLLLAGALLAARAALSVRALAYTGLTVLSVLSVPTIFSGQAWRACTDGQLEKCSVAGALFKSFYESENYIAMVASFTLAACLVAMRRAELVGASAFCLLIIVATGSRTSYLAVAAAGAWALGSFLIERRRRYERIHLAVCAGLVLVSVTAATYLMWSATKTTLSNRGNIWIHAREYLAGMQATGVGVSKWYHLRDVGEAPTHFFHSGYVLAIFAGGFIALAIWSAWAASLLHGAVLDGRAFSAKTPMVLLLVYSFTEVVWNPLSVDGLSWIFLALMLTRSATASANPLPVPGPVDAVSRPDGFAPLRRLTARWGNRVAGPRG
ncbi:O-antigen ligase family protein [Micromonospora sp. NPDC048999]|uniref:O-antigen ligase family protein n=1 Tax=Micromonospora sp. NPDC048999 TaxID=3155391 RepID=UPI0033E75636